MEEKRTKKWNWSLTALWVMNILLITIIISVDNKVEKVTNSKVSSYIFNILQNKVNNLKYPQFKFENGLQKIDDKIMVSIEDIQKYLDGYKIKIGVLNTSALTLDEITLVLNKELETNLYLPKATFKLNHKIQSGTMIHETIILTNTSEKELTKGIWNMEADVISYYFKDQKY